VSDEARPPDPPSPPEPPPLTIEQARLLPFYHDLRNEIVQPDKVLVSTQYFWTRWAPRLGPTLTALVVCLRRHCYYNRLTQERRDWCFPEQATLAREIGVETTKTIRAALQHPLATYFVRREARYVYDPHRGKKIRTSDLYHVAMDDPLLPEDEAALTLRAAERLLAEGRGAEVPLPPAPAPGGPKDRQVRPPGQSRPRGQFDRQVGPPDAPEALQDSAVICAPEVVPVRLHDTTKYSTVQTSAGGVEGWPAVEAAFRAANHHPPTPAQLDLLAAIVREYDPLARQADPPTTGAVWVRAAIREAADSGSHFVAPRRVARICARWRAEGFPGAPTAVPPATAERPSVAASADGPAGDGGPPADGAGPDAPPPSFEVFPGLGLRSRPFWQAVCDEARRRLLSPADGRLLDGSQLVGREGQTLLVGMPGRAAAERAERRLAAPLQQAARAILGQAVEVTFVRLS
jgi:hypothetical protein